MLRVPATEARHSSRDGCGKQGIETDRLHGQGDTHQKGDADQRPDLTLVGKEPGQRNPQQVSDPVDHGGPEDGPPDRALLEYLAGGNGQDEIDECGSCRQHADLEPTSAEAGSSIH